MSFFGGLDGKESTCNEGDLSLMPELGRSPRGGHGNPLRYSCLENPHGQRSLEGYSPWGRKESDMTEQLSTARCIIVYMPITGSVGKKSACNAGATGDAGLILHWADPWRRKWQPTPVFSPGEFHGQRSLAGYSPWDHKELDTTE